MNEFSNEIEGNGIKFKLFGSNQLSELFHFHQIISIVLDNNQRRLGWMLLNFNFNAICSFRYSLFRSALLVCSIFHKHKPNRYIYSKPKVRPNHIGLPLLKVYKRQHLKLITQTLLERNTNGFALRCMVDVFFILFCANRGKQA